MQVKVSDDVQVLLQRQVERDGFASAAEAIKNAIQFYESYRPTMESLNTKLLDAHQSAVAGVERGKRRRQSIEGT